MSSSGIEQSSEFSDPNEIIRHFHQPSKLTPREADVFGLVEEVREDLRHQQLLVVHLPRSSVRLLACY